MDLTRLRRELRMGYYEFVEAEFLLDALDECHERAELCEDMLKRQMELTQSDVHEMTHESVDMLIKALVRITSIGVEGVLERLIEETNFPRVTSALAEMQRQADAAHAAEADALGDLDDHPF